jgi:hypothetical protein
MSVCTTTTEWIRENISKPIEEWEERTKEKCKKRSWWNPLKWLCYLVTYLVKVIRWVVISVVRAVVSTVCRLIVAVLGIIWDALKFLGLLLKALFTWDKCVFQEALAMLGNVVVRAFNFLGEVIWQPFGDVVREYQLRNYVREQIEKRFADRPDFIASLKRNFQIDSGVFGYRLNCKVYRLYVDSQTTTRRFPDVPNLAGLHRDGLINLYVLAGFHDDTDNCDIFGDWYRPRPQTAVFPFASGGGGIGDPEPPPLKRDRLKEYIDSEGSEGPHFRIYSMTKGNLEKRTDSASEKGRQLGLILSFDVADHEVTDPDYMFYSQAAQPRFLKEEMRRIDEDVDAQGAKQQLCSPLAAGVFRFTNESLRGLTSNLFGTTACAAHDLTDSEVSGVTFIDDIPDEIRRYVLIHELGHYVGLCHVDGFHRIMVSGKEGQGDLFTWDSIPNLFFHGGPWFTRGESEQAWDFILDHFTEACLVGAALPPDGPFLG